MRRQTVFSSAIVSILWIVGAASIAQTLPNGVAAGDVDRSRAVLWTRTTKEGKVTFDYSTDPSFATDVKHRTVKADSSLVPVKAEISGLAAGTTYYYRATDAAGSTASGTFKTPRLGGTRAGLHLGVSGDLRGDLAPYPAIVNASSLGLDVFVNLGDTLYADVESPVLPGVNQATTLREFRIKNAEIYSERDGLNAVADLRASTSLLVTIDDHEVNDDFAGGAPPSSDARFDDHGSYINETNLFTNGARAFVEYNPIRNELYGATGDPRTAFKRKLYRLRRFGSDAAVFLLDERSFRDQGLVPANPFDPLDVFRFLSESFDPSRTMLGAAQLADLEDGLQEAQNAGVTWKFIMVPEPIQNLGILAASDRYEGYAAERNALLGFITDMGIENVVFVTADIHGTLVNNVTYQTTLGGPQIDTGAFEISTGPIAYDKTFGPTLVDLALQYGLISDAEKAYYDSLPLAAKELFVQAIVNGQLLALGYDTLGLGGSSIDATLLQGDYTATHTYGWTEFEIDASSQALTSTTWGLLPDELDAAPFIVSQFVVNPH